MTTFESIRVEPAQTSVAAVPRPPGILPLNAFLDRCTGCGDCTAVCPLGAISVDFDGNLCLSHPSQCLACGLCADVCSRQAIGFTIATRIGLATIQAAERCQVTAPGTLTSNRSDGS